MASEESPLLNNANGTTSYATDADPNTDTEDGENARIEHETVYNRFSRSRKTLIVCLSALSGSFPSTCLSMRMHTCKL